MKNKYNICYYQDMQSYDMLIQSNKMCIRLGLIDEEGKLCVYSEDYANFARHKGEIYSGIIKKVDANLNAVFVNYQDNKMGFLNLKSIHPLYFQINNNEREKIIKKIEKYQKEDRDIAEIYDTLDIKKLLSVNQKILVQIIRDAKDNKGVMLSTFICLNSRNIKYIPNSITPQIFCNNKKIQSCIEKIIKKSDISGSIMCQKEDLDINIISNELIYLHNLWKKIYFDSIDQKTYGKISYQYHVFNNFVATHLQSQNVRINKIYLNDGSLKNRLNFFIPEGRIINDDYPFELYEDQVDKIFSNVIYLPNGGYLLFANNPLGTTIDVNTGKVKQAAYRVAILQTNKEAIIEIFSQLRLRNISGLIIVDLIDMKNEKEINEVWDLIGREADKDCAKIECLPISKFGLLQICREYKDIDVSKNNFERCTHCKTGITEKVESISERILRKLTTIIKDVDDSQNHIVVETNNEVLKYLKKHYFQYIENICTEWSCEVIFKHIDQNETEFFKITLV